MLQKQRRSFLWCWRCGALGVWHLTWTVLTGRSHTQRPSPPLPTIQPPTTPTTPSLQHNTIPPPFYTQTPQYNCTTQPPPARDLFPGRWVPSIQRSVYFAYSQKCQHQASFCSFPVLAICLLWFYSSSLKRTSSSLTSLVRTLCISFGALPAPGRQRCQPLGNTLVHHRFNHLHHLNHNILIHHLTTSITSPPPVLTIFTIFTPL